nr:esterase 1 [Geocoris pallidipennis]
MVNYRVGIYGFLSFEDDEMPGNQGMKDQVMALRWVKENIAYFGGDPNAITLIGESAGGVSVYHHIISPLSDGLFHRAICESGTSYNNWAIAAPGEARKYAVKLLAALGYNYFSTKEAVEFLRGKSPEEVVTALEHLRVWQIDPVCMFKPVFESEGPNAFLNYPISSWKHKPVPLLIGMTSAEGLFRTQFFELCNTDFKWLSNNFEKLAPMSLTYEETSSDPKKVTDSVRSYYLPNEAISQDDWINLTTMYTDAIFSYGILEGANRHPGQVYFYYFDYVGEYSFAGHRGKRKEDIVFGACHTDEIIYLFKHPKDLYNLKGEDLKLSEKLVTIWSNFAKSGSPSLGKNDLKWDPWTPDKHNFMNISNDGFKLTQGLAAEERCKFWKKIPFRDVIEK